VIAALDITDVGTAHRIVQIQRAAYAVEARLIGFDGIPPLTEDTADVGRRTDLEWIGYRSGPTLAGVLAWSIVDGVADIDRLAVEPRFARRGVATALLAALPVDRTHAVSTAEANLPARRLYEHLGFDFVGYADVVQGLTIARYRRAPAHDHARRHHH